MLTGEVGHSRQIQMKLNHFTPQYVERNAELASPNCRTTISALPGEHFTQNISPVPGASDDTSIVEFVTLPSDVAYELKPTQTIGYLGSDRGTERYTVDNQ